MNATENKLTSDKWKEITILSEPLSMLVSQWGRITYQDWCERECARMNKNGGNAIVKTKKGLVCISRP